MASHSRITSDHEEIRKWAEERGGKPATVRNTGSDHEAGLLRIDFPRYSGEDSLEPISWDEFFDKFDEKHLQFVYQDRTVDGGLSRFNRFVSGDGER